MEGEGEVMPSATMALYPHAVLSLLYQWILDEEKLKQPRWSQFEHKLREFRKAEQKKQEQDLEGETPAPY